MTPAPTSIEAIIGLQAQIGPSKAQKKKQKKKALAERKANEHDSHDFDPKGELL